MTKKKNEKTYIDGIENYMDDVNYYRCESYRFYSLSTSRYRAGRKLCYSDNVNENTDALVRAVKSGVPDMVADEMIEAVIADNLALIGWKIKQYLPCEYATASINIDDVVQEVIREYSVKCIEDFDVNKGVLFNTYATKYLGLRVRDFAGNNLFHVKVSGDTYQKMNSIYKEYELFRRETGGSRADFVAQATARRKEKEATINSWIDFCEAGFDNIVFLDAPLDSDEGDDVESLYEITAHNNEDYTAPDVYMETKRMNDQLFKLRILKGKEKKKYLKELREEYADYAA